VREVAAFAMIATALFFAYGALLTIEVVGAGEAWGTISGFRNLL
jgi:hypothetical protein